LRWYGHVLRKDEYDCMKNAWIMKWKVSDLEPGQRKRGVRLEKKGVRPDKYATKMLWTIENGES